MQNLTKVSKFIFAIIITSMITGSLAIAEELGVTKDDMEDMVKIELKISKHDAPTDSQRHEVAMVDKSESEINSTNNNEQLEKELWNFMVDDIPTFEKKANPNKVKFPDRILNFGSDIYVAQPLFTGDHDSIYKGASRDDLGTNIGAAFRLVILNK